MVGEKSGKKITAIVPTYNEGERITKVLDILITYPEFTEIIVVDDGSTDNTQSIIKNYPVRFIKIPVNQGKGQAMTRGVKEAQGDLLFFIDADITGLSHHLIHQIIHPVLQGEVEMFIGMCDRKIYFYPFIFALVPLFGGQRALTKKLWQKIPPYYQHGFRIEAGLNFYAHHYGKGFEYKIIKMLSHKIKEKKYGLFKGLRQRLRMLWHIMSAQLRLRIIDLPESEKKKRRWALVPLKGFLGIVLGLFFLNFLYTESRDLSLHFLEQIRLNHALIFGFLVGGIGLFIGFQALIFLSTFKRLKYFLGGMINRLKMRRF